MADTIPDWHRGEALAAIAERLAAADPPNPALIDQARAVADTIPDWRTAAGRWPQSPRGWPPPTHRTRR